MLKSIALAGDGLPFKFGRIGLEKPRFHRQKKDTRRKMIYIKKYLADVVGIGLILEYEIILIFYIPLFRRLSC